MQNKIIIRNPNEEPTFVKIIKPNTKGVDSIEIYDIDKWSLENIWEIKDPLFALKQEGSLIVMDRKQMQNLARMFDKILGELTK